MVLIFPLKLFPDLQVMKRSPVLSAYREAGLIDSFPLHDDESLRQCYAGQFS